MASGSGALRGLRILVVDDDGESLQAARLMLEMNGAEIRFVQSGRQAREVLRTFDADLMLSDLTMPGQDGFELIVNLRRLPPEQGGKTDAGSRARALESGFPACLRRPANVSLLLRMVAALASRRAG